MNIAFHYFTVKTLCYYADLAPGRAQDIAFYSQLIDDFNYTWLQPGSCIRVSTKPPKFFFDNKLAMEDKSHKGTWWFYPATTGISLLQSGASLVNTSHQLQTLVPFHFIPKTSIKGIKKEDTEGWRCVVADGKQQTLMNDILDEFYDAFYKNGQPDDMKLGMLLHTYADTYAHQMFSGRHGDENVAYLKEITDLSSGKPKTIKPSQMAYYYPSIGHAELEHVPDAFALNYTAIFTQFNGIKDYSYSRYNMPCFLECAYKIFNMLCRYNAQIMTDETYYKNEIAPKIEQAGNLCVDGNSEIMNADKLKDIWGKVFPDIVYDYNWTNWGLTENKNIPSKTGYKCYIATEDFYRFNQIAYEHIKRVIGTYKEELL